jgi:hypothetical protein
MEERLAELGAKLDTLKRKARESGEKVSKDVEDKIERFDRAYREMNEKMAELKTASGGAWERLKKGVSDSYDVLRKSVEEAADRF